MHESAGLIHSMTHVLFIELQVPATRRPVPG
jgi:hypothetical protein